MSVPALWVPFIGHIATAIGLHKATTGLTVGVWVGFGLTLGATKPPEPRIEADPSDYHIRWLMIPERRNFLGKSLLGPAVLGVCVAPNRPSP